MEAFIKSEGKKIKAVYAHNDDMALGAIQALDEAGMNPGKDVIVVSVDGVKGALTLWSRVSSTHRGVQPAAGPYGLRRCNQTKKGETVPKKIVVKDRTYDQSTAASAIKSRKY